MKLMRSHTFGSRRGHGGKGRRGSVIVLVVAVLGLLAVIGTVYIVSSRAERGSASAGSVSINLEKAQEAVNQQVLDVIGAAVLDGRGRPGGYAVNGPYGQQQSRRHDMPEVNKFLTQAGIGYSDYNFTAAAGGYRDQAWLVSDLYFLTNQDYGRNLTEGTHHRYNQMSLLTASAFNPATGAYDLPFYNAAAPGDALAQTVAATMRTFRVVADPLPAQYPMADGNNSPTNADAFIQLLPFSEASGIRYRFGIRIVDTSSMANLNVGAASSLSSDAGGTYITSYMLGGPAFDPTVPTPPPADGLANLDSTSLGRYFGMGVLDDPTRLRVAMRLERPNLITPSIPFDLADEMALRGYGNVGESLQSRPSLIWPVTLGNSTTHRGFYTTYSYSRDLRPFYIDTAAPYTLTSTAGMPFTPSAGPNSTHMWPDSVVSPVAVRSPAAVSANVDVTPATTGFSEAAASDLLAMSATNIATAMELLSTVPAEVYTHQEACSFAANYITYRWNGWTVSQRDYKGTPIDIYSLPIGPSFVDDAGICVRITGASAGTRINGGPTDLKAEKTGKVYLGYAAQPFLNEVVELRTAVDDMAMGVTISVDDAAIELFNPYDFALNLDDFAIQVDGGVPVPLTGGLIPPRDAMNPQKGYCVISTTMGGLGTMVTNAEATTLPISLSLQGASKVYLMRRYMNRAGNEAWAAVDQMDVGNGIPLETVPTPQTQVSLRRPNAAANQWLAAVDNASIDAPTLGDINQGPDGTSIVLYDRTLGNLGNERALLTNVADFNRIMRVAHEVMSNNAGQPTPVGVGDNGTLSQQLQARVSTAVTPFAADAGVHFDFRGAPYLYSAPGVPVGVTGAEPTTYRIGDARAVRLLDCLAFVDRLSDPSLDFGDNNLASLARSKMRVPGRINVNTASPYVLAGIPALSSSANYKYIGDIMAYRWRTVHDDPRIPTAYRGTRDFNVPAEFPGYGIRSMAELNAVLTQDTEAATTVNERDQLWAQVYNYLTVRSDTFVLYGYIEAVKQNPRYAGNFNNGTDWYVNGGDAPDYATDDPTDPNAKLLRVARRRWVGIVDRSMANYPVGPAYVQPRIAAQRDLPR